MNQCLTQIGIEHARHRARAIDIGERLEVFKDYPTPPNCTHPVAPIWITPRWCADSTTSGNGCVPYKHPLLPLIERCG
jgi:hypothetical protein